ncbi:hypothetical protein [Pseudomonas sp. 210_17 TE3656]
MPTENRSSNTEQMVSVPRKLADSIERTWRQNGQWNMEIHGWHVHSNGFNVHQLLATNYDEAQKEACWLNDQRDAPFDRCAYVVVEIDGREHLPRRLTWRERLTGKIQ